MWKACTLVQQQNTSSNFLKMNKQVFQILKKKNKKNLFFTFLTLAQLGDQDKKPCIRHKGRVVG